jgi:hypothetical protein
VTTAQTIYTVAERVRDEISTALAGVGTPVDVAAIYPAAITWDKCDCGTLAVAVQRQYVTSNFPNVVEGEQLPCNNGFVAADFVVQVLRCAPQPRGRDVAPTTAALQETAQTVLSDGWVVLSTVQCLLGELVDENLIVQYVVRPQLFAGPAGGCVGSILAFVVAVEQSSTI